MKLRLLASLAGLVCSIVLLIAGLFGTAAWCSVRAWSGFSINGPYATVWFGRDTSPKNAHISYVEFHRRRPMNVRWWAPSWLPNKRIRTSYFQLSIPLWIPIVAFAALAFYLRPPRPKPGACRACGYDLRGNTSGRCPECGGVVHPSAHSQNTTPDGHTGCAANTADTAVARRGDVRDRARTLRFPRPTQS